MEDKIKELIEGIIKKAEDEGLEVEVHKLSLDKEKEPDSSIQFEFCREEVKCTGENIDSDRIITAVQQLLEALMNLENITFHEAVELVVESKDFYEKKYTTKKFTKEKSSSSKDIQDILKVMLGEDNKDVN